jgi:hypothetical protein
MTDQPPEQPPVSAPAPQASAVEQPEQSEQRRGFWGSLVSTGAGMVTGLGTGAVSLGIIGVIAGVVFGAIVGLGWYFESFLPEIFGSAQEGGSGVFLLILIPVFVVTMVVSLVVGGAAGGLLGAALGALIGGLAGSGVGWAINQLWGRSGEASSEQHAQSDVPDALEGSGIGRKILAVLLLLGGGAVLVAMVVALVFAVLFIIELFGSGSGLELLGPSLPHLV